jgi:hypothetical protein
VYGRDLGVEVFVRDVSWRRFCALVAALPVDSAWRRWCRARARVIDDPDAMARYALSR